MQHKTKRQKERASQPASEENMILTWTQGRINIVEHLDALKVENVAPVES